MSQLKENLQTILSEKNSKIIPENIKNGVQIFNIEGTMVDVQTGTSDANASANDIKTGKSAYVNGEKVEGSYVPLDTSDATATENDLGYGKTAYVNGQKVIGELIEARNPSHQSIPLDTTNIEMSGHSLDIDFVPAVASTSGIIINSYTKMSCSANEDDVANAVSLTPNILKKNETVLGVVGTFDGTNTSDATATEDDLAYGKSAYVKGEKVSGRLDDTRGASSVMARLVKAQYHDDVNNVLGINTYIGNSSYPGIIVSHDTVLECPISYNAIANEIGLNANQIKLGDKVLGVTGTYSGTNNVKLYYSYNEQNFYLNCAKIAAPLQALIASTPSLGNYNIITGGASSSVRPILKIANLSHGISGNSLINRWMFPSVLAIGINPESKYTALYIVDYIIDNVYGQGNVESVIEIAKIDQSSSQYYRYSGDGTMTFSDVANLLNSIGNVQVDVQDDIVIYNDFEFSQLIYEDPETGVESMNVSNTYNDFIVIEDV